jgi:hypothetical protein
MKKIKTISLVILMILTMNMVFSLVSINVQAHFFDPGGGDDDGSGGDTSSPYIAILSPTENNIIGIVTLKVAASDNVGVTKVKFYIDGVYKSTDYSSYYTYSWNTGSYTLGTTHTVKAIAYDKAGNSKTTTKSYTIVDSVNPSISITSLEDEFNYLYQPENDVYGNVIVKVSASDNIGVTKVKFYIDGVYKSTDASNPYEYIFDSKKYSLGGHEIKVIAYDESGNSKSATKTFYVTYHEESLSFQGSYEDLEIGQSIAYSLVETYYAKIRSELFFYSASPKHGKTAVNLNLVTVYSWKSSREIASWKADIPGEYPDGVIDDVIIEMEETSSTYEDDCNGIFEKSVDTDSLVWPIGFRYSSNYHRKSNWCSFKQSS